MVVYCNNCKKKTLAENKLDKIVINIFTCIETKNIYHQWFKYIGILQTSELVFQYQTSVFLMTYEVYVFSLIEINEL